jgi:hypothetical protein
MKSMRPLAFPPLHRLSTSTRPRFQSFSRFGAIMGLQVFLTVALLPLLLYGGVTSERVAVGIFGEPELPAFGVHASIVLGVVSAAGASIFALLGGMVGALVRARVDASYNRRD